MVDEPLGRVPLQELVGKQLGDYALRRILGHGSMGVVFEAAHAKLGRRVALKVLPPGLGATEKAIQRFLREAQAVAQLSHENIVPIYEIGNEGATHFYAMQFLDGEPLDAVLKRGPIDPREASQLACTAARAIHFAHQRGIIHRDVKPANMIRLREGERDVAGGAATGKVVLTDFGLARPEQGESITDSGAMVGTPLYMSPEQVRARKGEIDRRTDVYSLGATLYEMVAGRPPFSGESTQEILQRILDEEPRPPRALASHLHEDLEVVILKALEKEPKRRYASALEFAQDLERYLEGEPILASRTTFIGRGWRRVRKQKTVALLVAAVVLIVFGFSAMMKASSSATAAREFKAARDKGDAAFGEGNHLAALAGYEEALARRDDDDARLGRARALCALAKNWELRIERGETDFSQIVKSLGTNDVEKVYARAKADVDLVVQHRPDDALALFYAGILGWRATGPTGALERKAGVDLLIEAGQKAGKDWRTHLEFASFRLGLSANPKFPADTRSELLQQALSNASDALKVMRPLVEPGAPLPSPLFLKEMARAHRMRADVYKSLYDAGGDASAYVDLCLADAKKAISYDERDARANDLFNWATDRLADLQKARAEPAPAPTADSAPRDEPSNLARVFSAREATAGSEFFAKMLQKGGELLASGWQQTDGIRTEVMDRFVNPYFNEKGTVPDDARIEAARLAREAREELKHALESGKLDEAVRRSALEKLRKAVDKNPRSPQFFYELAVVEQDLKELDAARAHLLHATEIATSNPIFFHQLALVCEQLGMTGEALAFERRTFDLAPGNPDYVAKYAALALAMARAATPETRGSYLSEARKAAASLEQIAPQHDSLAPLKKALDELEGRAAPAGG